MTEPRKKQFFLSASAINRIADGHGACLASDRITVDGQRVRWAYREASDFPEDSGWRFFAGDEDDDYMENALNFGIYNCNTIANYDTDIIPHLTAPIGTALSRLIASEPFTVERHHPPAQDD